MQDVGGALLGQVTAKLTHPGPQAGRAPVSAGRQATVSAGRDRQAKAAASPVVQRLMRLQNAASEVAQRKEEWKPENHPDKALDPFVTALDRAVQKAARDALNPDDLVGEGGYIGLWKATADILRGGDQNLEDLNEDERAELAVARRFAPARYGYAVETLACAEIDALNAALPQGLRCLLQQGRGMTRPDLIVVDAARKDVGWFDITSANSADHIYDKIGSGWHSRNYVAEVTYEPLDISTIGTSELSIAERNKRRNAAKALAAAWQANVAMVKRDVLGRFEGAAPQNKQQAQSAIRAAVSGALGVGDMPPVAVKSVLRAIGLLPKDFGLSPAGGTKAEGEGILRDFFG